MTNKSPQKQAPPIIKNKRFLGKMVDHKLHGVMEYYDDDQQLIAQQTFDKGILNGESLKYDQFHKITEKLIYQDGKLHGSAEFYNNGIIRMQTHFHKGKQDGETLIYDESGLIQCRIEYAKGLKQGTWVSYDPLGRIRRILNYNQNLLEGPMVTYFPSGSLMESGHYIQGQRQGEFYSYYENGVIRQILVFDKGQMIQPPQLYDVNGYPTGRGIER